MALTDVQEFEVRQWLGATPGRAELDSIHDHVGSVLDTILYVLRERQAALMAQPKSFSLPGEYSQTNRDAKELAELIAQVEDAVIVTETDGAHSKVKHLVRYGDDCWPGR